MKYGKRNLELALESAGDVLARIELNATACLDPEDEEALAGRLVPIAAWQSGARMAALRHKRSVANIFLGEPECSIASGSLASLIAKPGRRALGAANAPAVEFAHSSELNQSNTVV
jgi:hypothetical protein